MIWLWVMQQSADASSRMMPSQCWELLALESLVWYKTLSGPRTLHTRSLSVCLSVQLTCVLVAHSSLISVCCCCCCCYLHLASSLCYWKELCCLCFFFPVTCQSLFWANCDAWVAPLSVTLIELLTSFQYFIIKYICFSAAAVYALLIIVTGYNAETYRLLFVFCGSRRQQNWLSLAADILERGRRNKTKFCR